MRFGMDFRAILGRFGTQVGAQVGTKIRKMEAPRRCQKKWCKKSRQVTQDHVGSCKLGGWGSLIGQSPNTLTTSVQGDAGGLKHSPRAQGPVADTGFRRAYTGFRSPNIGSRHWKLLPEGDKQLWPPQSWCLEVEKADFEVESCRKITQSIKNTTNTTIYAILSTM